jgi:hypothetical protein
MSSLRSISVRSGCAMPAAKAKQTQGQSARRSALSCGCAIGSTRPRLGVALGFFKNIENRKHRLRRAKVLITTALGGWGRSPPVFALQRPLPALCRLSRHSRARLHSASIKTVFLTAGQRGALGVRVAPRGGVFLWPPRGP